MVVHGGAVRCIDARQRLAANHGVHKAGARALAQHAAAHGRLASGRDTRTHRGDCCIAQYLAALLEAGGAGVGVARGRADAEVVGLLAEAGARPGVVMWVVGAHVRAHVLSGCFGHEPALGLRSAGDAPAEGHVYRALARRALDGRVQVAEMLVSRSLSQRAAARQSMQSVSEAVQLHVGAPAEEVLCAAVVSRGIFWVVGLWLARGPGPGRRLWRPRWACSRIVRELCRTVFARHGRVKPPIKNEEGFHGGDALKEQSHES